MSVRLGSKMPERPAAKRRELEADRDRWREKAAIFASAIGLARLHLLQGDPKRASDALDAAVQKATEAMARAER